MRFEISGGPSGVESVIPAHLVVEKREKQPFGYESPKKDATVKVTKFIFYVLNLQQNMKWQRNR